ncbi:MAG: hypothetical protein GY870_01755 [archaeon]|nr:hypothetical protein [archaeon]
MINELMVNKQKNKNYRKAMGIFIIIILAIWIADRMIQGDLTYWYRDSYLYCLLVLFTFYNSLSYRIKKLDEEVEKTINEV